ncbi:MAG: thioredoxin family protein [Candidatus Pedobacter colombiensis]|uniref:Thioredoxin family protein n=1 Tax=Candidatus Pedobacter colombiensis TaxID=3121371 RepID=A0AAJ5WCN1_9SPHI|nr:thioredoxin family protein [Pedobacter sp.]WEK21613.1 MAG: thioredoxin family protein [Pedobacter sp.]
MKNYIIILLTFLSFSATAQIKTLTAGTTAPDIKLKNVDGKIVGFDDFPKAKGFVVVFTCNTCPYAQAYEQRIIALNAKSTPFGYPVIAVNPNDPELSKGNSFEKMKERAASKKYTFPYLFDPGQKITNLYGAAKTPHFFLVKKTDKGLVIEYTGALDDDPQEVNTTRTHYIEDAINELNAGKALTVISTKAIGCTVVRAKK